MSDRSTGLRGNRFALEGPELKPGDKAPDFKLQQKTETGIEDVKLADYAGKTLLLSVVPSLDTPVCAIQTKTFNERASQLPANVEVLTVSMDLPFAQGRFCGAEGIDKIKTASDHRDGSFGKAYGVLIKEGPLERVLSRAIFVVGPDGVLKHVEYVPEVPEHPNYDSALRAAA
jgi:thiol peroxidase